MIRFLSTAIGLAFIVAAITNVNAQQCRTVVRTQTYVAPTHQQTYQQSYNYVAPYVAVYQPIPVYSVGYADQSLALEFEKLKTQLESFKLQQVQRELNGVKSLLQPPQPNESVYPKKQSTLLSTNGMAQLSDRQYLSIAKEVYTGRMPKGKKFTDEQVGLVMDWLDNPSVKDHPAIALLAKDCQACHGEVPKGNKFVMFTK